MFPISFNPQKEGQDLVPPYHLLRFLVGLALILSFPNLLANPTQGTVAAGSATVTSNGNLLTITQTSSSAIINWQGFSIGSGETTSFLQPSSTSSILNRVLGGSISQIDGTLSANGHVVLINQNGIVIGSGGIINTTSFMASSRDITDTDFSSGHLHFKGNSMGSVTNLGTINALGGDVILLGKTVENEGSITATPVSTTATLPGGKPVPETVVGGTAALVSADDVVLTQQSNKGITITVSPSPAALVDKAGAAVLNGGTISARTAQLKAAQGNLYALAINNTGYVKARTLKHEGGHIILTSDSGTIRNSGTLDANADVVGGQGGTIFIKSMTGKTINTASGKIVAKNGRGGKGGQIETSGDEVLLGGKVDAGQGGNWLIDPDDLTIDASAAATITYMLNMGGNVMEQTTSTTAIGAGVVNPSGMGNLFVTAGLTWTGTGNLTLKSFNNLIVTAPISGVSGGLTLYAGGSITDTANLSVKNFALQGGNWTQNTGPLPQFTVANDFSITGGTFLRVAGGTGSATSPYLISDAYGLQGINSLLVPRSPPLSFKQIQNIDASTTASWNTGMGFLPIGSTTNPFFGIYDGSGFGITGLTINRPSQSGVALFGVTSAGSALMGINLAGALITGNNYVGALVGYGDHTLLLNCTTTESVNGLMNMGGLVGYNLMGSLQNCSANGTVSSPSSGGSEIGGLVGFNAAGSMQNCFSMGMLMCGTASDVGGLVGNNAQGGMINCSANEYVSGGSSGSQLGGLVGTNTGLLQNCFATGGVLGGSTSSNIGGLVGLNNGGVIKTCFASGTVNGSNNLGGLIGANSGTVVASYALGNVAGSNSLGGLMGVNKGTVQSCFAHGSTNGSGDIGGLIGDNAGNIYDSHADGSVNGLYSVGGLVGSNIVGSINFCFANGAVTGSTGAMDVGGLVGANSYSGQGASVQGCFATGDVVGGNGSISVGGLVGTNYTNGLVFKSFATNNVSGTKGVGGLVGQNLGLITISYAALGEVNGTSDVGGLVGANGPGATIRTTFAADDVFGAMHVGGMVGSNFKGSISSSYWLQDVSLDTNLGLFGIGYDQGLGGASNNGATPETFADLLLPSTYDSTWNFTPGSGDWGVNGIDNNTGDLINEGLPFLQAHHPNFTNVPFLQSFAQGVYDQFNSPQIPQEGVLPLPGQAPIYFSFEPSTNTMTLTEEPASKTTGSGKEHQSSIASGSSYQTSGSNGMKGKNTVLVVPGRAIISMIQGQFPSFTPPPALIQSTFKVILGPGVQQALEQALKNSTK